MIPARNEQLTDCGVATTTPTERRANSRSHRCDEDDSATCGQPVAVRECDADVDENVGVDDEPPRQPETPAAAATIPDFNSVRFALCCLTISK